jgi:hypothetical protein
VNLAITTRIRIARDGDATPFETIGAAEVEPDEAKTKGYDVADRGRIKAEIIEEYDRVHAS